MDIVVGIIAVVIGLAVCFAGYRLFLVLLPIWGFVVGFWLGSALVDAYGSDTFLATTAGWIAGIIIGIVFACSPISTGTSASPCSAPRSGRRWERAS